MAFLLGALLGLWVGLMLGVLAARRQRRHHHPSGQPARLVLLASREGADVPMQMRDNQQTSYTLELTDAAGNPVEGGPESITPAWSTDRSDLVRLDLADDGLSANVVALGGLGDTVLTVSVQLPDNEDGSPGALLQGSDVVSVIGDDVAAEIKLTAGEPTDQ